MLTLIQPVAVMSTITGNIVLHAASVDPSVPGHVVASALSVIVGGIICFIGLVRLGWLVEFIPLVSIAAYMTGSAIFIACGQIPTLLGQSSKLFDTRASTYLVIIHTLQYLPEAKGPDAAMGVSALAMLYIIRSTFNYLARKQPNRAKLWFFCNTLRSVFVILLYTLISWLVNRHLPRTSKGAKKADFKILGPVPRGFQDAGAPTMNSHIISLFASQIPVSVIVVLIEHISIAKSFGRINNYTINPSQEMVAIGVANLLAPFLGGYPSTGSFSRTAIKSKAGVRTPLAGVITAIVVLISIYGLQAVFFFIPSASLSAIIIHAVGDLITPPNTVYQFWRTSPMEVPIFFAGVLVTVFTSIEDGIYTTICCSLALYLWRVFKAQGRFMGRVKVHSVIGDHLVDGDHANHSSKGPGNDPETSTRNIFLPMGLEDGSNPELRPEHPYPGIFIYRFSEGYNYPNAHHYLEYMTATIFQETQRTNPNSYPRPGDRPWNDPGPRKGKELETASNKPTLKAVILDFAAVNNVDLTSVQNLIDVRNQLDRYAQPHKVQWHFASIKSRWTKRALASAGFGYSTPEGDGEHRWKPIFSVADIGGHSSAAEAAEEEANRRMSVQKNTDLENGRAHSREVDSSSRDSDHSINKELSSSKAYTSTKVVAVHGLNRPFFHLDLTSALQSAIHNTEKISVKPGAEPEMVETYAGSGGNVAHDEPK